MTEAIELKEAAMSVPLHTTQWVDGGPADEVRAAGMKVVTVGGAPVLVLWTEGRFHAVDNRCPHMGFPLSKGNVHDGLLDCHWHHARFDITCGATLDPWADDVDAYRVEEHDGRVWIDPARPHRDPKEHGLARLRRGLMDGLSLVTFKAVVEMEEAGVDPVHALAAGAQFGAGERDDGWQPGLSILTAAANVRDALDPVDRQRATAHALAQVSATVQGHAPRRPLPPLEGSGRDRAGLRDWLRETVEVRDGQGAERVLWTLVTAHGAEAALDAVLAACTDHRYADGGHTLDYAVKCAELVEHLGTGGRDELAGLLFSSLAPQLVQMQRMEETSAWRRPVDVAAVVADAYANVPPEPFTSPDAGRDAVLPDEDALVANLLGEDPAGAASEIVRRLREGAAPVALAEAVLSAATERILAFGTVNELADWDTVHHTQTYANAVAEAMRRAPSRELFRAVLDGAMSVYLERFLNVPPAQFPSGAAQGDPDTHLRELVALYDRRSAVDQATRTAWAALETGAAPARLLATLGQVVLREDSDFHAYQQLDIAWRRLRRRGDAPAARRTLVATARWLAAQYPTRRGREQTFAIARRLHRGDSLHA